MQIVSLRLKSIKNIEKITKSMKMIASTKVTKAQRAMESARTYGQASLAFVKHAEVSSPASNNPMLITCSSDRGLCGGIHSSLSKATKAACLKSPDASITVLGLKCRTQLSRSHRGKIVQTFDGVTKFSSSWFESAIVGHHILSRGGVQHDGFKIVFNSFKSVIAYESASVSIPSLASIQAARKMI